MAKLFYPPKSSMCTQLIVREMTDPGGDAPRARDIARDASFAAFEQHTTGFGSRMLSKMGFKVRSVLSVRSAVVHVHHAAFLVVARRDLARTRPV